jgi:hypothetical protein
VKQLALVALSFLVCSSAVSQPAPTQAARCAESFPARHLDAKKAIVARDNHLEELEKNGTRAAIDWFNAHCRFLSPAEIVERKLDDENAFVCDPKAKGRPRKLTSALVIEYSTDPPYGEFQEHRAENGECFMHDQAERIVLVFGTLSVRQKLEVLCFNDDRASCMKVRKDFAEADARAKAAQ